MREISWLPEKLLASYEGICSMEVFICLFKAYLMAYSAVVQTSDHSYLNASKDVLLRIYVAFVEYGHQV